MSRVFITGSAEGLGRNAAQALIDEGHEVVLHARSKQRAAVLDDLAPRAAGIVIGDLASAADVRSIAAQVNGLGRMQAVIHNAGVYSSAARGKTPEGHATTLAVNVITPYLLTLLIARPQRLIYLSSGMHTGGTGSLDDIDWTRRRWEGSRAYSESKLYVTALALAFARLWPDVRSNAVNPGWVATRMGGANAPDDLEEGHLTQVWLAVSDDADALSSGGYWHHRRRRGPARQAADPAFQSQVIATLASLTGVSPRA